MHGCMFICMGGCVCARVVHVLAVRACIHPHACTCVGVCMRGACTRERVDEGHSEELRRRELRASVRVGTGQVVVGACRLLEVYRFLFPAQESSAPVGGGLAETIMQAMKTMADGGKAHQRFACHEVCQGLSMHTIALSPLPPLTPLSRCSANCQSCTTCPASFVGSVGPVYPSRPGCPVCSFCPASSVGRSRLSRWCCATRISPLCRSVVPWAVCLCQSLDLCAHRDSASLHFPDHLPCRRQPSRRNRRG